MTVSEWVFTYYLLEHVALHLSGYFTQLPSSIMADLHPQISLNQSNFPVSFAIASRALLAVSNSTSDQGPAQQLATYSSTRREQLAGVARAKDQYLATVFERVAPLVILKCTEAFRLPEIQIKVLIIKKVEVYRCVTDFGQSQDSTQP